MKRFHVHVAVEDIQQSTKFYSNLFGYDIPTARKAACCAPEVESVSVQIGKKCT